MKSIEYVCYYRVQGGSTTGFSKSREMLQITRNNGIEIESLLKKVHIGAEEHNRKFIELRKQNKVDLYSGKEDKNFDINVIKMYFPKFFAELLRNYSISEYEKTGTDPKAPPHKVDISKGEAYAVFGAWNAIMQSCCLYATNINIKSMDDSEIIYQEQSNISERFNPINIEQLKNFLIHAASSHLLKKEITQGKIESIIKEAERINDAITKTMEESCK